MDFKQEDDFWNFTSGHSFAFDDEDADLAQVQEDDVLHSTLEVSNTLPLQSVISADNLKLVLEDVALPISVAVATRTMQVDEIVRRLCLGVDCSLDECRSQEEKLYLLDRAVDTFDGNVILKVVLFVVATLRKNIAFRHLATRPLALQQYCNYLSESNKLDELHLLYMASGNLKNLVGIILCSCYKYDFLSIWCIFLTMTDLQSNLFYLSVQNTSMNNIHTKLSQFNIEHVDSLEDEFEKAIFHEHKKFLDYQLEHKLPNQLATPSTTFAHLCKSKLDKLRVDDPDLQHFLKLMKISPFKSEWIMLNIIAAHERWPMLGDVVETQKWFNIKGVGRAPTRKYNVGMELIVSGLHKHRAPRGILEDFLKRMDDVDKALYLGMRYECHSFVVDTLAARRDRLGLMEYKDTIASQADWVRLIDKALLSDKRWSN